MQDLTLVGLTEDKKRLILVSDSGEEFTLPADAKLRAALRGDHVRLGQLETQMDSALRPRDIQARIRAGESPEDVAQAAQTTVDRIMSYATPVLAERAHIADRAQSASVRRKAGDGPAKILGDAVAEQLRSRNVDPDHVEWDSWRREDGRWSVTAEYRVDREPKHAVFTFDVQGRYVVAEDDDSRWLVGEEPASKPQPRPGSRTGRRPVPFLRDEALPLGDDAIEMVNDPTPQAGPDERTVDLTRTARELRRDSGTTGRGAETPPTGDADWMATQATDRPTTTREPAAEDHTATEPEADRPAVPEDRATLAHRAPEPEKQPEPEAAEEQQPEPQPKKPARKGRRASVPSWDEIMFGGGRSD
jgi:hypothetical protein